ncbi:transmembrane protein 237B-like isoform X2 [Betta splendens]|uniref:Transmembrane protein 237B-like isoform X2 n=1 Tax=Betta splendens TaxID=158456 RepID=A0A9W2XLV1_BETSP|nr:transmembrane protein 237B-like isoform X2 [Betta splendens]
MAKKTTREQRTLPTMLSQDIAGEVPASKQKKKKAKRETHEMEDVDDQGMEMGGLDSRRTSLEIGDPVNSEPTIDPPPQRRKKKKKTFTSDIEDDKTDLVNGDIMYQTRETEEVVRKPRKKKKSKVIEQLPDELDVEEDDIISDIPPVVPQQSLFSAPQGQSQPVRKVFVERNKHFQAAERSDWRKTSDQMYNITEIQHMHPIWTTRDISIRVHEGFRVFGLYCHGFLAGYAVWNVVVVYMLAGQQLTSLSNLLEQYQNLAYPSQSLLYLLLAISTVAAFDRVNLAKGSVALREFITLDLVALASFLYFSALVLCLSQQMTSDRINLYSSFNSTLWSPGSEHQILHSWVTVNLVVALLVGLAWIFIATRADTDYTEGHLLAMEIEPIKPEDKLELNT